MKGYGQEERSADLIDTLWLTSTEEDDVLTSEEGGLDVEVLNVSVLLAEPLPAPLVLGGTTISTAGGHHELELVLLEVDLDEYGDDLVVVVDNVDMFSDSMFLRKGTGLDPGFRLHIIVVALVCL